VFDRLLENLPKTCKVDLVAILVNSFSVELAGSCAREYAMVPWDDDSLSPRAIENFLLNKVHFFRFLRLRRRTFSIGDLPFMYEG